MAHSRLTIRTLGLATIALVLACGHAVQAMQAKRSPVAKPSSHLVAQPTSKLAASRPGAPRAGPSGIATVRGGRAGGGGSAGSVATFSGEAGSFRPASRTAPGFRISTPAQPYSSYRTAARRAAPANVRHITVSTGAADPAAQQRARAARTTAPAPEEAGPKAQEPKVRNPAIAAALRPPVQRPAPKRNAFAIGLAAVAMVTPATGAEVPAARPRAAARTSRRPR